MRVSLCWTLTSLTLVLSAGFTGCSPLAPLGSPISSTSTGQRMSDILDLPKPRIDGSVSVESALAQRRSVREFDNTPLALAGLGQILWAAQGLTDARGYRTAPSAGALYPLEVYVAAGNVVDLPAGIYRYLPREHRLATVTAGDHRADLAAAAVSQHWVADAPAVLVIAAVYERTTGKYGQRGIRYAHMEVGHAAQNVYLQAVALDLGTTFVGAFSDDQVSQVLSLPEDEQPLGIMPVGRPRS